MLCPSCGSPVGDKMRLCERCYATRTLPVDEEIPEEGIEEAIVERDTGPLEDESYEPALPPKGLIHGIAIVAFAATVALVYFFFAAKTASHEPVPVPVHIAGPRIDLTTAASIQIDSAATGAWRDARAYYDKEASILEVRFASPSAGTPETLSLSMFFTLARSATLFERHSVTGCVLLLQRDREPSYLPCDQAGTNPPESGNILDALSGALATGQTVTGLATGAAPNGDKMVKWDLRFRANLSTVDGSTRRGLLFDRDSFAEAIALTNSANDILALGLFQSELSPGEVEQIQQRGLLDAGGKKPFFRALFLLKPGSRRLSLDRLERYTVTVYQAGKTAVEREYRRGEPGFTRALSLDGLRIQDGTVAGMFHDTAFVHLASGQELLSWNLPFAAKVVVAEAVELSVPTRGEDSSGPFVALNGARIGFASTAGIVFTKSGRVEIGFFRKPLSEAEVATIRSKNFLRANRGALPDVVLAFESPPGGMISAERLAGYTVYFYRELDGVMFSGGRDIQQFARTKEEFGPGEVVALGGATNGKVSGEINGSGRIPGTAFEWHLKFESDLGTTGG